MKQNSYTLFLLIALILTGCTKTLHANAPVIILNGDVNITLTDLSLESNVTTLNVGEKAELTVVGTYSDGSTSELDENVEYIITPTDSVELNGTVLTAKKDSNVTVQAKVNGVLSNTLNLTIAWVVNGHVLPPEPDPIVNDSTLLGIDVNDNGVRDDVERYIYERFGQDLEYPKTKTALAMQDAWATQKILETPTIESKKYLDDAIDCQYYWFDTKNKILIEQIKELANKDFDKAYELEEQLTTWERKNKVFNDISLKDMKLNTKERILTKFKFNEACSGHIFRGRGRDSIEDCQTNIDLLGE